MFSDVESCSCHLVEGAKDLLANAGLSLEFWFSVVSGFDESNRSPPSEPVVPFGAKE